MSLLTVSIVLYNTDSEQLNRCLTSLKKYSDELKIYLIDNSPSPCFYPTGANIEYIHNPSNPGFGAAHNIAIHKSFLEAGDYHLVLNADVYFDAGVLEELENFMNQNLDVGLTMPKVFYPNGDIQYLCKLLPSPKDLIVRRFIPFNQWKKKHNNYFEMRFTDYNQIMEVPYLSGCFMFLRKDALRKIGGFDERFFMYPEDIDLSRRIHEHYKTIFYPSVCVIHEFGGSSHKSFKMFFVHLWNLVKYFNKWGWFFDQKRDHVNKKILHKLGVLL
jgi:GT2 family glycosyltransferase